MLLLIKLTAAIMLLITLFNLAKAIDHLENTKEDELDINIA